MKKIVFLTGTRADFGKLKSLIKISQNSEAYETHIFATGMHMNSKYGKTVDEIYKAGFKNIYQYINHDTVAHMDRTLAKTIDGFSLYINEIKPDLIIIHGDRVEALAGAIVGSLNNILVAHIEGGEISGTIDELIRHAVSKMSHIHFVTNDEAKGRLVQLGERSDAIFVIGSPDLDLMNPKKLPALDFVKNYYEIGYDDYAIALFHPVTTEYDKIALYAKQFVDTLVKSDRNYILIYPNNDLGSAEILNEYKALKGNDKIRIYPSIRFEYFLTLLMNAEYIIGNSSVGIREAPYYRVPTIDIGTRQNNRAKLRSVLHAEHDVQSILDVIASLDSFTLEDTHLVDHDFGEGKSDILFMKLLESKEMWAIDRQKQFQELTS
tara:strand:+ start:252 stop:1388 length:1137 start_codon:yes stop_codon:yes gene_type:complete